jgi:hypothetical protein
MRMARKHRLSIGALLVAVVGIAGAQASIVAEDPVIMGFETMVGVPQAFTGTQNPIRGINGGGIPWVLDRGRGELSQDGSLEIRVRGLVLASGANAGSNPVAQFRGLVSCLRSDATIANVLTGPFPATTGPASAGGGNARIQAKLDLPEPCIAPIIFVTSPTGSWFASTGG